MRNAVGVSGGTRTHRGLVLWLPRTSAPPNAQLTVRAQRGICMHASADVDQSGRARRGCVPQLHRRLQYSACIAAQPIWRALVVPTSVQRVCNGMDWLVAVLAVAGRAPHR